MIQDAQEVQKKPDVLRPVKIKRPKQEPPREKPMSVGGFGENLLQNAWDIAKGFVSIFPTALKSGAEVFGDTEGLALLAQNPEHLVKAFRDTGKAIKDAVVHPYEKHGVRVLYEEPLTPVLDAMTILSLGGGSLAKMGRMAGAGKVEAAGRALASVPEKIAAGIMKAPYKMVGINPETRTGFLRIRRHELSGAKLEASVWREKILGTARDLSDEDWKAVEKLVLDGGKKADLLANPRAAQVYENLSGWLKTARESELGSKGRALLSDEQMLNRVVGELAERRGLDFKSAKTLYDSLEVKPLYAPAIRESGGFANVVNTLSPSVIRKGKVGFLEKWSSSLGADSIKTRLVHAIDDFYKARASLRLIDRVIQTRGWARAVKSGESTLRELLPEQGIYRKYFTEGPAGRDRARSLFISELEETHGKERATQLLSSDPATQKAMAQAVNIMVPDKTLRGLIAREFRMAGGDVGNFLRVYDRLTDLFRSTATKLSPRWYTGNVIGDALLASLAGSNWGLAKRLIQEHLLPRTIRSGKFGLGAETGNALNSLSDVIGAVDDAARAGIFSKVVADKVRATVGRFAASEDALRTAITEVSLAPDELADLMVRNQQLGEHVARGSRQIVELDKELAKEQKTLAKLSGRFDKAKKDFHPVAKEMKAVQDRIDILTAKRESYVADLTRNMRARDIARYPELQAKAEIAEQAMDRANTFLGEYLGLGPIERGVFRRLIPFYPWMKAMAKLAFTFPFIAPTKAFFWHRYASAMTELMGDPELPEWLAPYAPVFLRQNGDTVWARITSVSPFGSLRTEHFGGVPIPSILAFWQSNPWINLGYRLAGGQDMFNHGTVPYGEPIVAINDGETYKFNEHGKLEKIITQPPLFTSTAHMFPVVQMIDQLISNYDVRKGKPILNSDGSVKYPLPFLYRLLDAGGLKLMDRNREKVIRSEKIQVRKALQDLKSQYKRSGPEDREYIKGVFQDYANGEYRRIEATR